MGRHPALAEATWVLTSVYDRGPADIATAIEMVLNHQHLTLQDPEIVVAAVERFRKPAAPGFSDCLMLEIARKAGHLPLGTFDRTLGNHGRPEGRETIRPLEGSNPAEAGREGSG